MKTMHSNIQDECFQEQIKELAEFGDHEYYMSALPKIIDDKRVERGKRRIQMIIKHLKQLKRKTICTACLDEINRQVLLQEQAVNEIIETNPEGM